MRIKGKISTWHDQKGYGFVDPIDGGKRIFIHISAFNNRNRRPEAGQVVTYALSSDKQGRPCAAQATLAGDRLSQGTKSPTGKLSILSVVIFLLLVAFSVIALKVPPLIFALYLIASTITFIVYAVDKSAARKGAWRTQESTLHLLSFLGGWPGALVAQQKLRHKSRKQSFRVVFWITVIVNCGIFVWTLTPDGATVLRTLIAAVV